MGFSPVDLISGLFSVIVIVIFAYVGLRIILKYFEVKQRVFLLVGLTWIGLSEPWWGSAVSFLVGLTNEGVGLQGGGEPLYFFLGNFLIPVSLLIWMTAFTDLLYKDKQKIILIIFAIYGILFETIFLYLLFTNHTLIGALESATDVNYVSFVMIFLLSIIVIIFITGNLFARESIRSENPEIKLKGKYLRLAYILFCFGALLDAAIPFGDMIFMLPITRIILITSAVLFYGGFMLPSFMRPKSLKKR